MAERSIINQCVVYLLEPIVRFCIQHSIKYQTFVELSKAVFVNQSLHTLDQEHSRTSAAAISLVTGIHRKDIARLLDQAPDTDSRQDIVTRVIGNWQLLDAYRMEDGSPRILSYRGENSEFWRLVRSVSTDVSPYTVLKELERTKSVQKFPRGVKLLTEMRQLRGDDLEAFKLVAQDTEDLLISVKENVATPDTTPNLHIKTEYDQIPIEYSGKVKEWILDQGSDFHRRVREFLAQYDQDLNNSLTRSKDVVRVAVGSFSRIQHLLKKDDT
jgi:hypothetical protein